MADPDDPEHLLAQAHVARALAASLLVGGTTDPDVMVSYRRWMATSRLLGDIGEEEAATCLIRAEAIFVSNCAGMKREYARLVLPPHLEPDNAPPLLL